jgi:uncharacterized membrane protein
MTEAVLAGRWRLSFAPEPPLDVSARLWFLVTTLGHWIFVAYVAGYYTPLLAFGGVQGLQKAHLFNGYIPGDTAGNFAVAGHVLLAVIILGGGPLQLIPQIRARFPTFHRWLGRTYMLTAVTSAAAGLYLIWTLPLFGALITNIATSIDGILIIVFAGIALRYAIARDIRTHRRWAMRLFMVTSSVWFLRIGFRTWNVLTGGIGIDDATFTGPFVYAWHFGQYLLPLAVLELYFRARDSGSEVRRSAMAAGLFGVTVLMTIGIVQNATNSWLPRLFESAY